MSITQSTDFIERQTLMEAVSAEFMRNPVLLGTPAVIVRQDLDTQIQGRKVQVPYWANLGNFTKMAEDQAAAVRKMSQSSEEATVQRASLAVQVSHLAEAIDRNSGGDMYEEIAKQVRERAKIFLDNELIDLAVTTDLIYTAGVGSGAATPTANLSWVEAVKASLIWTDDGQTDPVLLGVHSKPWGDLVTATDGDGRPLMANAVAEGRASQIAGIPLKRSNRLPVNTTPDPDEYTSIIARAGAMALWFAPPIPESDKDILVHSSVIAFHMYFVSHMYKRVADNDQKGVVKIISR